MRGPPTGVVAGVSSGKPSTAVSVYWRPGCPWCALLRRGLEEAGISTIELNIWEDPSAAAKVREVAGGNETVPTVFVGDVALVNPSVAAVKEALAIADGGAHPDGPRKKLG